LFTAGQVVLAEDLADRTYAQDMQARGHTLPGEIARTVLAVLVGPARPRSLLARLDRWRWYSRPYRVAIALMKVN
jgi:hypothetical protein